MDRPIDFNELDESYELHHQDNNNNNNIASTSASASASASTSASSPDPATTNRRGHFSFELARPGELELLGIDEDGATTPEEQQHEDVGQSATGTGEGGESEERMPLADAEAGVAHLGDLEAGGKNGRE